MKRIALRLPEELHGKVKEEMKYRGYTINKFMLELLWKYFEELEKQKQS